MVRRPPSATRTDTLVPYTTRCRSVADAGGEATNATTDDAGDADEQAQLLFAMDRRRLTTFGFFEFSLAVFAVLGGAALYRSEEHTSELQSLMRISYAVFCLKKKNNTHVKSLKT